MNRFQGYKRGSKEDSLVVLFLHLNHILQVLILHILITDFDLIHQVPKEFIICPKKTRNMSCSDKKLLKTIS